MAGKCHAGRVGQAGSPGSSWCGPAGRMQGRQRFDHFYFLIQRRDPAKENFRFLRADCVLADRVQLTTAHTQEFRHASKLPPAVQPLRAQRMRQLRAAGTALQAARPMLRVLCMKPLLSPVQKTSGHLLIPRRTLRTLRCAQRPPHSSRCRALGSACRWLPRRRAAGGAPPAGRAQTPRPSGTAAAGPRPKSRSAAPSEGPCRQWERRCAVVGVRLGWGVRGA